MFYDNTTSLISSEHASKSLGCNFLPWVVFNSIEQRLKCGLTNNIPDNSNKALVVNKMDLGSCVACLHYKDWKQETWLHIVFPKIVCIPRSGKWDAFQGFKSVYPRLDICCDFVRSVPFRPEHAIQVGKACGFDFSHHLTPDMYGADFNSQIKLCGHSQPVAKRFEQWVTPGFGKQVEVDFLLLFIVLVIIEHHSRGGYPDFGWKDAFTPTNQNEGGIGDIVTLMPDKPPRLSLENVNLLFVQGQ